MQRVRRPASNPRSTRPGPPRRAPRIPGSRTTLVTKPRPIPADPGPETVPELVDVRDHQHRALPSREKADAVVKNSFARLNRPTALVIIQQRESAPDSADQFHCLAMPTYSFTVCTM